MEHLTFAASFEVKEMQGEGAGAFEGYASTFGNVDHVNDVIEKGAYKATIEKFKANGSKMPLLYQHNTGDVRGVITYMAEDVKGLHVQGRLLKTERGQELREMLKEGAIRKMSIGFMPKLYEYDQGGDIRVLKEIDLFEVSMVTFPANEAAVVTNVKSLPDNEREFEKMLRQAGYSQNQAKAITCHGFKAAKQSRDAGALSQCDAEAVGQLAKSLDGVSELLAQLIGASRNGEHRT